MKKRVSRFTDKDQEAPGDGYREVRVSANEYHKEKLEEFRASMKDQLKSRFRSSFVQKGKLEPKRPAQQDHDEQRSEDQGEDSEHYQSDEREDDEDQANRILKTEDIECLENSAMNCFGMLSRDAGHSRVPAPPHIMTGMMSKGAASHTRQIRRRLSHRSSRRTNI